MQTAVDVVTSIPWTLWVFIAVIVVPIAFHYVRAWRERWAQRRAYQRAVESGGSLTELLPEDSRPHVRRLHRIAAERHSVLQPLHTDTTAGAATGRESISAQLARQLYELPEVLDRLEHDAASRVFTTQERDELADRTKNAADVYERLGAVLTRGVAAVPEELTSVEAAKMIGVSRPTLIKMARTGEIPSRMVGTHTRFLTEDVRAFLRRRGDRSIEDFNTFRDAEAELLGE